jgi:hypothetical protein
MLQFYIGLRFFAALRMTTCGGGRGVVVAFLGRFDILLVSLWLGEVVYVNHVKKRE